jgi:hypothetical protein
MLLLCQMANPLQQMAFASVLISADNDGLESVALRHSGAQTAGRLGVAFTVKVVKPGIVSQLYTQYQLPCNHVCFVLQGFKPQTTR